ncbi:uncharacterized protein LOC119605186 isoform X2 [Lucilia sericata]|uniref:uncharacterized protein LOC119605186 isoform X2 n=1 Tax=Lucilia sericata TaxID=13632 RepID=UPI0018A80E25|nr:uncharacterized protein LOC119605186 isoform X2 [Lucilia sericata]
MSSVLHMLGLHGLDEGFNLVIILPVVIVIVAILFLLNLSVRKSADFKKPQTQNTRKQKVTTNKQNEEKLNSNKRDKKSKEKISPAKTSDGETNKKQPVANEKSPKKNVQTKKQQVTSNNVNKSAKNSPTTKTQTNIKKQLESFVSKEEEGEWQMVTTKKQKKITSEETIEITTASKTNKNTQKTPEKTNKANKTKKVKIMNETADVSSTIVDQVTQSEPSVPAVITELPHTSTNSTIKQKKAPVPESTTEVKFDNSTVQSTPSANVAFDELGDDGWTDTKPQKKNRKKALRE